MMKQRAPADLGMSVWGCGLRLEDFEIPSNPTPVAMVASAIASVTLDLADARSNAVTAPQLPSFVPGSDTVELDEGLLSDATSAWAAETGEDLDFQDRKVLWPQPLPASYAPSTSVQTRIEDNIAAILLMQDLAASKRKASTEEAATLLRYSGWGGAARVFSPDGTTQHRLAAQRDRLKAAVTSAEYTAMQASVNTAFYTPPELVQSIWKLVEHLGFKGGRIIEPAAGVGHLLANMPTGIARKSTITAVEKDPISAALLETNFAPYGVQVQAAGLEDAKLPLGFFDLVVGNVPFGNFKTNDSSKAPYADWLIHNWFLGKSIELVRPGGLVVVITSSGSLDSTSDAHRKWLAAHAELIAAFRLPTMAFKAYANTEAVTDLLVLRRREIPDFSGKPQWLSVDEAEGQLFAVNQAASVRAYLKSNGQAYEKRQAVNLHFHRHPAAMLGKLTWESGPHGPVAVPVLEGDVADLQRMLDEQILALPEAVYQPGAAEEMTQPQTPMLRYANDEQAMPGALVLVKGRICICEGDEVLDVDSLYAGTARKRVIGMIAIRRAALKVIQQQARSNDDGELAILQRDLNGVYDAFVAQLGPLSTTANSRLMRGDPNWPLLLALEIWNEDTESATKADIFSRRTVGIPAVPDQVDSVKDALLLSLAVHGRIDLREMAKRYGKPVRAITDELRAEGLAYRDPGLARWVPADEYLSGHIRQKIAEARAAGPAYEINVPALEAVIPQDLGPAEVEARLGAPWIPCDVVKTFAAELVNDTRDAISVDFDRSTATWSVKAGYRLEYAGDRALQTAKWGTDHRSALELLESALNQQPPTVTMTVDDRTVVNTTATLAAREKWQAIRDEFRMWVYRDDARRDRLLRLYNDTFNQVVPRRFDGSHLHLPGMSLAVQPYPHQKDAIWRILVNGNTLLAHCVGAGKTLTMVAASMELRRLGKARKPLHVVPNHCLEQYTAEAVRLYPQARVLMASKDDLSGDKRRTFVARIATGDWDAVIMTQSTFERLMLSIEKQREFIDDLLEEARTMMSLTQDRGAKRSIKEIEKRMKDYEAKLTRLVDSGKADDQSAVWFDELGIDFLFEDEAHALKNLGRLSKMPRIAGLPNVASQRAFDAFMKTRLIMRARGGREEGLVFATATPISNSLAEMHTMQIFLQPMTLRRFGIYEFDAWSASFGEAVTGIELAPDGSGFRTNTRYCKFVNLPELMSIFKGVADIRTKRMLNLPTPRIEGGKPQIMVAKPSDALKSIVAGLVKRAEAIRMRTVRPDEDNMLAITNDGRRAAIDVRMVDGSQPADPRGKLALAADNIHRIWIEGAAHKVAQLAFCDLGTPGAIGFSVYEELKRLLLLRGIPADQIAFIQDFGSDSAKAKLFKRVRDGIVRVLLGSTSMMGTGTNVQKRLKAVHQIDAPWKPSDVEQRDGRGERQGNECESLELWRYVTEGSFDAYSWNLLDVKARFIDQVMTSQQGLRTVEDISMTALSYAELKAIASGNPLVMEKATVDATVQKLALAFDHWEQERWRLSHRKANLQQRMNWINNNMARMEADGKAAASAAAGGRFKPISSHGVKAAQAAASPEIAIGMAFKAAVHARDTSPFGEIGGFVLSAEKHFLAFELEIEAPNSGLRAKADRPNMNDLAGVGRAALDAIARIAGDPSRLREEFGRKTEEVASIEKLLAEDFDQRAALAAARARQAEIDSQLDLDKAAAGSQAMDTESA
jgi:N12 class adenine-specific DNA methylase